MPLESATVVSAAPIANYDRTVQSADIAAWEGKRSRSITVDYQAKSVEHVWNVQGTPWEAFSSTVASQFKPGSPHPDPLFSSAHLTRVRYEPRAMGTGDNTAFSEVTALYQETPCPFAFGEEMDASITTRPEWYSRPINGVRVPLNDTIQPVPLSYPVPIYRRHFYRVQMNSQDLFDGLVGRLTMLNGNTFKSRPPGYWMFEGLRARQLFRIDNDNDLAAWDITLQFRGDPRYRHQWVFPKIVDNRPIRPQPGQIADSDLYNVLPLYEMYPGDGGSGSFDSLIPYTFDDCKVRDS